MSGLLRLVPDTTAATDLATHRPAGAPHRPADAPRRRPRWAVDPVDELVAELTEVCGPAVHPDEIAAVLEADGLTAEQVQERYGRRDTFELAAELYERSVRHYPKAPPRPDPWRAGPGRFLLRGLVFTLPGLGYTLGTPLLSAPPDHLGLPAGSTALAASALAGWAWNQALAHRAFTALALGGRAAAARSLLLGAPLGALLATAAALAWPAPGGALAFAAGQAGYLAAATVLLVLGRELLLLATLLPTVAGAALLPLYTPPPAARAALLLATLAAVGWAAVRETVRAGATGPDGPRPARRRSGPPLRASVPYGLFGLGCGVLTMIAALGDHLRHSATATVAGPLVVALTLSMGAAEWLLHRCRGRALAALARSRTPAVLFRRAGGVLLLSLTGYLAALALLSCTAHLLWPVPGDSPPLDGPRLLALLSLGAVLWTGLLLQAFGTAWPPALVCLAAAGAEAAALARDAAAPTTVQLLACTGAAAVLLSAAAATLGRTTTHR